MKIDVTTKYEIGQEVYFYHCGQNKDDPEKYEYEYQQAMVGIIKQIRVCYDEYYNQSLRILYEIKDLAYSNYHLVSESDIATEEDNDIKAINAMFNQVSVFNEDEIINFKHEFFKMRMEAIKRIHKEKSIANN